MATVQDAMHKNRDQRRIISQAADRLAVVLRIYGLDVDDEDENLHADAAYILGIKK